MRLRCVSQFEGRGSNFLSYPSNSNSPQEELLEILGATGKLQWPHKQRVSDCQWPLLEGPLELTIHSDWFIVGGWFG